MPAGLHIYTFALPFVWGLVILASWIGWGRVIASAANVAHNRSVDAGLCAGWGMSLMIFFGGILNAATLCSGGAIGVLVAIGAAIWLATLPRSGPPGPIPRGYWPLILIALLVYTASVRWRGTWNRADDYLAYLVYPIKMLASGAALDPFSLRRLSSLGGYSFLQASVAVFGQPENAFLLDVGLGGLLACLVSVPMMRRAGAGPFFASFAGAFCLTVPLGRLNSTSSSLSLAGFLVLFRTVDLLGHCDGSARRRLCWVVGLISSGLTTIRPNFLAVVGLTVLLSEFFWTLQGCLPWRKAMAETAWTVLAGLCAIGPWCVSLHAAANSYFYPLWKGNQRNDIELFSAHMGPLGVARFVAGFFLRPKMLVLLLPGAIGLVGSRGQAKALYLAAVIGAAIMASQFTDSDYANLTRYSLPPLAAATLVIWIVMQEADSSRARRWSGRSLIAGVTVAATAYSCLSSSGPLREAAASIYWGDVRDAPVYPRDLPGFYLRAQQSVPAGATILTMVDDPFLLDYRRNPINSIDQAGFVSPAPGIPFFHGSAALSQYLSAQSIQYLMCMRFDQSTSLYSWHLYNGDVGTDPILTRAASHELDIMRNIDELARTQPVVFDQDGVRVIRLN